MTRKPARAPQHHRTRHHCRRRSPQPATVRTRVLDIYRPYIPYSTRRDSRLVEYDSARGWFAEFLYLIRLCSLVGILMCTTRFSSAATLNAAIARHKAVTQRGMPHHMGCVVGAGQEAVRRAAAADQQVVNLKAPDRAADTQVRRAVAKVDMDARGPHCNEAELLGQVDRCWSPLLVAADGSLVL